MSELENVVALQKIQYARAEAKVRGQAETIYRLRDTLITVGRAMGCLLSDSVSNDFLYHLAEESQSWKANRERLTQELKTFRDELHSKGSP